MGKKRINLIENDAQKTNENVAKYINYLVNWIREKVLKAHCKGVIVGISGGIDSALVCALALKAFPNNTLGVVMPIDNMSHDKTDIDALSKSLNTPFIQINLASAFDQITCAIGKLDNLLAISNIKPRLRMTTLYALAQENNYLVLGTDNEDETYIGYFTKYGDGGVDILPISRLLKCEVRLLAKYLNVPESIINKAPSAGIWEGQTDENELGFTYNELDNYLMGNAISKETIKKIEHKHLISEHKRNIPDKPLLISDIIKN